MLCFPPFFFVQLQLVPSRRDGRSRISAHISDRRFYRLHRQTVNVYSPGMLPGKRNISVKWFEKEKKRWLRFRDSKYNE